MPKIRGRLPPLTRIRICRWAPPVLSVGFRHIVPTAPSAPRSDRLPRHLVPTAPSAPRSDRPLGTSFRPPPRHLVPTAPSAPRSDRLLRHLVPTGSFGASFPTCRGGVHSARPLRLAATHTAKHLPLFSNRPPAIYPRPRNPSPSVSHSEHFPVEKVNTA
jgi:hypothetical protein